MAALSLVAAGLVTLVAAAAASTQHVTCTVSTAEIVATARAELSSVCSTKDMEDQLLRFQLQLLENLTSMQAAITSLESKLAPHGKRVGEQSFQLGILQDVPQRVMMAVDKTRDQQQSPSEATAHYDSSTGSAQTRVFEYAWRVTTLHHESLRSPSFYVSSHGYRMYLRLRPHASSQSVFVYAGLTRGDYDHFLHWPFVLRHRVQVVSGGEAMESRLWDPTSLCGPHIWQRPRMGDNPECVGFAFPYHVLQRHGITIKLTVLLE